jgi:hypothetical protein
MFKRLINWFKRLFQGLFGGTQTTRTSSKVQKEPPPPLSDTDLEFLFTELLEGVHQARGQAWVLKWLQNIESRVSVERWLLWLNHFREKLLASPTPNNELAARLVQLGELEVGQIGDVAYDIGMQLLTRNQTEPIWEYDGPDTTDVNQTTQYAEPHLENSSEEEFQTITLDQLFVMLQQDENLRQTIAQQLGIQTDDPTEIVQTLVNQFEAANQSANDGNSANFP